MSDIKLTRTLTDPNGIQLQFIPPKASESEYGGIKAKNKTTETNEVVIDSVSGKGYVDAYTKSQSNETFVSKETGKGLSSNDYTSADKVKVSAIPENAKYTDTIYDDTEISGEISQVKEDLTELSTELKEDISTLDTRIKTCIYIDSEGYICLEEEENNE